ncbi:MAG TPA: helicase-related protein [Abditibacteriaceae bacterium]|jgi:hypothetical protein
MVFVTADELVRLVEQGRTTLRPTASPQQLTQQTASVANDDSNDTPDLDDADLLILLGYDPKSGAAGICPRNWKRHGLDGMSAPAADRLSKAVQDMERIGAAPFALGLLDNPFDAPFGETLLKSQEAANSTSTEDSGPSERWITVHPHGEDGKGVPVKIKRNHDKSWSVAGGAGGKINGLRLVHVKSPEEYKRLGKERSRQQREKQDKEKANHFEGLKEKHRKALHAEAEASGGKLTPEHIEKEAGKRATNELRDTHTAKTKASDELEKKKQQAIEEHLNEIAKAQGWDTSAFRISEESLKELRSQKEQEILASNPKLRARLASDNETTATAAREELQKQSSQLVQKVQAKHQKLVLRRVMELDHNLSDLIATAADGISHETMGDVSVGDLVRQTLGDSGKGYVASLREQAEARGMALPDAKAQAEAQNRQSRLERHDFDLEGAARSEQFVERVQAGAAAAREEVRRVAEKLGEKGEGPLGKIQSLDTMPKASDTKSAVETLARLKQLKATLAATEEEQQRIKEAATIDEIPKAAVAHASELSDTEALEQVLNELGKPGEVDRQRAMGELIDCYNAQDAIAPLVSHRFSGHNAFFTNVAQVAGARGPDPLMADILGPEGTSHVLRRAFELATKGDVVKAQGLRDGLEAHHVETQIALADAAVEHSKELLNQAENLEDFPLNSVDALMAGLDQAKQKNDLVRQAREHLGVALGRLEAGAALNYAFMGKSKDEVQIPLGAISMEDAIIKAGAAGLTKADVFDPNSGELTEAGHFRIYNDGKNKFLVIHNDGLQHLAQSLQEDPEHLKRIQLASDIKEGKYDESDWLPKGFSPRPAIDVSGGDGLVVPRHDLQLNLDGQNTPEGIANALQSHIAQRIEAGQDPISIVSAIRSQGFRADHVPADLSDRYSQALQTVAPDFKKTDNAALDGEGALEHQEKIRALFEGYHSQWIKDEVVAGRVSSSEASIHSQTLPLDYDTRDLIHQVTLQDPRFKYAFTDVGCLDADDRRQGRAALRDYAFEHIFRDHEGKAVDPKNKDNPIQALSPDERRAWEKWRELSQGSKADPYVAIQKHLAESAESSGGGLFGDEVAAEPHVFASVDLNNDAAVIAAAKQHAADLGFKGEARNIDLQTRKYDVGYPDLETGENKSEREVASVARRRIKGWLRDHAFRQMMGTPDLGMPERTHDSAALPEPHKTFNPDQVHTGSQRWAEYVAAMGGGDRESERRAYQTIQEKMRGDFAARFAKGYRQLHGKEFQTAPIPLTYGDAHSLASLSRDQRKEVESQSKSERAKLHKRSGGKFDFDNTGAKLEAKRRDSLMGDALFSVDDSKSEKQQLDTHRLSLGGAAESMVRGLMPNINLKKGTAAAGDIDMSSATGIKRQRAIKQIEAMKRVGLTLGVGCVHATTVIYDPIRNVAHSIRDWMERDEAPCVWALDKGGKVVATQAGLPYIKCYEEMFEVRTVSNDTITVAGGHLFLTPDGWKQLRQLEIGATILAARAVPCEICSSLHGALAQEAYLTPVDVHSRCPGEFAPVPNDALSQSHSSVGEPFGPHSIPERAIDEFLHHAQSAVMVSPLQTSSPQFNLEWTQVTNIESKGLSAVYDLEVFGYQNYLAHGLWHHNTGKTAISLGAFSHLKSKGKVERALMAVPSVVQEQFGSEAARFYDLTDKNHPQWFSEAGASPDERRAAYHKDSGHDICVVTHQALRDDLTWAVAQHKFDGDEKQAEEFLANAPEVERNAAMQAALDHHGWHFGMSVVDEGHNLLNRVGKENSAMANTIDAFTSGKDYHVPMSADLLGKNDASESFDALRKIAPSRYVNDDHPDAGGTYTVSRSEFLRKYNVNTSAAQEALKRELAPYHYAESIKPDSALEPQFHSVEMTPPQKQDYNNVLAMFQRARAARKRGAVDVEAIKTLSPSSFANMPAEQHEELAARLAGSLGILRDAALDRVVNQHPQGAKIEWLNQRLGLDKPKVKAKPEQSSGAGLFGGDEVEVPAGGTSGDDNNVKRPEEHCPIIFAHNREAVDLLEKHLADKGVRTARLDGSMTGAEKEAAKVKFSPQFDKAAGRYVSDPGADVMICSDAGAVGWNGQRSRHIIHWDTPHTSMVHEQRTGRAYRVGQEHDVQCDTVMTDTPYERSRRKRLERKAALRETLTTPAELIDDTGLALKIFNSTQAAIAQLVHKTFNQ